MSNEQKSPNMIMEAKERFPELAHYFDEKDVRDVIEERELDIVRNLYHRVELFRYIQLREKEYDDLPDLISDSESDLDDEDEDEETKNGEIANLCLGCGQDLGPLNPRQYCCKTHCPYEVVR